MPVQYVVCLFAFFVFRQAEMFRRQFAATAFALVALVSVCSGQPSPFNMFAECPEGCRDVDLITSCGSLVDVAGCTMSVNGDVELVCTNGNGYFLGQFGCSSNASGTDALDYFFDKTRHCVSYVSTEFYEYRQYFAPAMAVLLVWITVAGYRFISPTLTIFAFIWEFFFALYFLIMAGSSDDMALYFALGLAAFVALLCFWRGPMFGRAVVGLSMGTLVSVFALAVTSAPLNYITVGVVIALDIIGIVFAYLKKRSSIVALFGFSVGVMMFVCIASWGNYSISGDAKTLAILAIPSFVAAALCVGINAFWCHKSGQQKRVNRRFEATNGRRGRPDPALLDESMTRPGHGASPRTGSPANGNNRNQSGYGAVYADLRV